MKYCQTMSLKGSRLWDSLPIPPPSPPISLYSLLSFCLSYAHSLPPSLYVFRLDQESGQMTLLSVTDVCENPAFLRFHPHLNVLYACTESMTKSDDIIALSISPITGELRHIGKVSTQGMSTCYITVDRRCRNLLFANYWDSTLGVRGGEG